MSRSSALARPSSVAPFGVCSGSPVLLMALLAVLLAPTTLADEGIGAPFKRPGRVGPQPRETTNQSAEELREGEEEEREEGEQDQPEEGGRIEKEEGVGLYVIEGEEPWRTAAEEPGEGEDGRLRVLGIAAVITALFALLAAAYIHLASRRAERPRDETR